MATADAVQFNMLREEYNGACDINKCKALLNEMKVLIAQFPSVALPPPSEVSQKELLIARETLEYGAFLSVRNEDVQSFERYVVQLKMYYYDYSKELPPSQRQLIILGMYLLHLLSSNRIGEFHTELELIPSELRSNVNLKFPVALEQHLMDGNYNKVINAKTNVPLPQYSFFMDRLVSTVRHKVAACLEKSYPSVDIAFALRALMLDTEEDLKRFAESENQRKQEQGAFEIRWEVKERLEFQQVMTQKPEISSTELLHHTIAYATELERIV